MSEQKSCPEVTKKNGIHKKKLLIVNLDITHKTKGDIKSIILHGVELSSSKPNNIVKLNSGKLFSIVRLKKKQQNFFFHGFMYTSITDVFKYTCNLTKIGIMKLGGLCKNKKLFMLRFLILKRNDDIIWN